MKELVVSLVPVFIVAFVSAHTPGPNNVMIMQSCMMFGYKKTIPHILGIILGFCFMMITINLGLNSLLITYPQALIVIKVIGSLYFVWFAYKIFTMNPQHIQRVSGTIMSVFTLGNMPHKHDVPDTSKKNTATPFTFFQACMFQWVNAKAWLFATSVASVYTGKRTIAGIIGIVLVVLINTISSANVWALLGVFIGSVVKHVIIVRIINGIAGITLLLLGVSMWV